LAGAVVVLEDELAAGACADFAACFLCFFVVLVVSVELLLVELEAAGVCAMTVPIMRERPIKAEAKSFMLMIPLFCRMPLFGLQYERRKRLLS
jgi:hypothetical protein